MPKKPDHDEALTQAIIDSFIDSLGSAHQGADKEQLDAFIKRTNNFTVPDLIQIMKRILVKTANDAPVPPADVKSKDLYMPLRATDATLLMVILDILGYRDDPSRIDLMPHAYAGIQIFRRMNDDTKDYA